MMTWTTEQSRELYSIASWSGGYFDITDNGDVAAFPSGAGEGAHISLPKLAAEITSNGLDLPVLVRFTGILRHRVASLCQAFTQAMREQDYQGEYTAVYPIKVNQQRHVVHEILSHEQVGLEAGSKPELMAVLALAPPDGGIVVCNGYKDREYIRLALIGQQLGLRPYIVVEKSSELKLIIEESARLGVSPRLGVRVRLAAIASGKWQNTGGEKGKFGLSSAQVLAVIDSLQTAGMLACLQLMHFHIGSQVANIRDIQAALHEAGRYYRQLRALGAPVDTVDVGGGLGVDYDGTRSRGYCSMNYSMREYANTVVRYFKDACTPDGLPHPRIFTESGRAMTAHHALLITNVTDVEPAPGGAMANAADGLAAEDDDAPLIRDLRNAVQQLNRNNAVETYHDIAFRLQETYAGFTRGALDLRQRAQAEQIYFAACHAIRDMLNPGSRAHREVLDELAAKLADKYFINLSLFQSIPDVWAIDQIFPIMPLARLREAPNCRAILQDLTCDSDGCISQYVDNSGLETSLPVHVLQAGESYLLGIFLVGAYQEILGDMHNLFGDTHSVNVELTPDGGYCLAQPELGDTVEDMLRYVHYDVDTLRAKYRHRLQATDLSVATQMAYLQELQAGLRGYTYLEL